MALPSMYEVNIPLQDIHIKIFHIVMHVFTEKGFQNLILFSNSFWSQQNYNLLHVTEVQFS